MARGDYAIVKVRTPIGVDETKIRAEMVGGSVEVDMPRKPTDLFVEVRETNQKGQAVRTARFLGPETLSVVEGHESVVRKKALK